MYKLFEGFATLSKDRVNTAYDFRKFFTVTIPAMAKQVETMELLNWENCARYTNESNKNI